MSIVASEQSYFLPQMRTKILNEGAAVLAHQEIGQRPFRPPIVLAVRAAQRGR